MNVEVITTDADPDHGGFGARVHGIVNMLAQFANVRLVRTAWLGGPRIPGVRYDDLPLEDSLRTRLARRKSYYRTVFPKREREKPPDLVIIESLELLGLHQYGPHIPFMLDEHNVYWNLLQYELVNTPFFQGWIGRRPATRRWLIPRVLGRARRYEIAAIRASARTLVTSEVDRAQIVAASPESAPKVRVLPNCVDVARILPLPEPEESTTVTFVGDFAYGPNRDGARFVCRVLAPSLPGVRFLLVGANPPPEVSLAANVAATGRVPDLRDILRDSSVCIAPLAQGSGTRVKILTYLAAAKAVVATTKACEGLPVLDGHHLLIRDDPGEFRDAVAHLLQNPEDRRRLGRAGRALVESSFDWRLHVDALRSWCEEAISRTSDGRAQSRGQPTRAEGSSATGSPRTHGDSGPSPAD